MKRPDLEACASRNYGPAKRGELEAGYAYEAAAYALHLEARAKALYARCERVESQHGSCPYCKHELNANEGTGQYECPRCIMEAR